MKSLLFLPLLLLISFTTLSQDKIVLKPYWELKDSRNLLVSTEVFIYKNDTIIKQTKGKSEGLFEVIDRGSKDFTVVIAQDYNVAYNNYNLFLSNILENQENVELYVKLDKSGVPIELLNEKKLESLFLANAGRKIKSEKKGIKIDEIDTELSVLQGQINTDGTFKENILSYASVMLNMYGKDFPATGIKKEKDVKIVANRYGVFAEPTFASTEKEVLENKGTKIVTRYSQTYEDPTQIDFFTGIAADPATNSYGIPVVTDVYVTTYESKAGWPQKKVEESTVVYGPYKHFTRVTYKFVKDK